MVGEGGCSNLVKTKNAEDFGFRAIFIPVGDKSFKKLQNGDIQEKITLEEKSLLTKRTIPEFIIDYQTSSQLKSAFDKYVFQSQI